MKDTLKAILAGCETAPNRLAALLPKGTQVARKTGTGGTWKGVTVAIIDVGVIRLPNGEDVVIAVLVGEPRGPVSRAERVIARVARTVYDAERERFRGEALNLTARARQSVPSMQPWLWFRQFKLRANVTPWCPVERHRRQPSLRDAGFVYQ